MNIRKTRPIEDQSIWPALMASLDEPVLQAHMRDKSQKNDVQWMKSFIDVGIFDVTEDIAAYGKNLDVSQVKEAYSNFEARVQSFTAFTTNTKVTSIEEDNLFGSLEGAIVVSCFDANEKIKPVFSAMVARVCEQHEKISGDMLMNPSNDPAFKKAMAHIMIGAICLDMRDELASIGKICPQALHQTVSIETMGRSMKEQVKAMKMSTQNRGSFPIVSMEITPHFAAMMLSRVECLRDIYKINGSSEIPLGRHRQDNNPTLIYLKNLNQAFPTTCTPESQYTALKNFMKNQAAAAQGMPTIMSEVAMLSITSHHSDRIFNLDAVVKAGVFDLDPNKAACLAIKHGEPSVIDAVAPKIHWGLLGREFDGPESPILAAMFEEVAKEKPERTTAMLNLIEHAQSNNALDDVLVTFKKDGYIEPIMALCCNQSHQVLSKYITNGLDLNQPSNTNSTLIAEIEKVSPETASVARSCEARMKAMDILQDLDGILNMKNTRP